MRAKDRARREIGELFRLAETAAEQELSDRYVELAKKLALKHRIPLTRYNRRHCRKCGAYFTSATLRVRTRPESVVYSCTRCGNVTRVPRATHRSSSAGPRTA